MHDVDQWNVSRDDACPLKQTERASGWPVFVSFPGSVLGQGCSPDLASHVEPSLIFGKPLLPAAMEILGHLFSPHILPCPG